MNDQVKRGIFTVDFDCEESGYSISIFEVKAVDGKHAETLARYCLNGQFTWRCTGTDRRTDARD
jgi:hypothetical protein